MVSRLRSVPLPRLLGTQQTKGTLCSHLRQDDRPRNLRSARFGKSALQVDSVGRWII